MQKQYPQDLIDAVANAMDSVGSPLFNEFGDHAALDLQALAAINAIDQYRDPTPTPDVSDEALGSALYESMCGCNAVENGWLIHTPLNVDDGEDAKDWYVEGARSVRAALASALASGEYPRTGNDAGD